MQLEKKEYWEQVYKTKTTDQVSWTQENPKTSLDYIKACKLPENAALIDIGGGDSLLVDYLLEEGYNQITVLDISEQAIKRAQERLGSLADKVTWIVSDMLDFKPKMTYDLWHDRATFHFLTTATEIETYKNTVKNWVDTYMVLGVFSKEGPLKCSGLPITQYNVTELRACFGDAFEVLHEQTEDHSTPFDTLQNFQFAHLKKK